MLLRQSRTLPRHCCWCGPGFLRWTIGRTDGQTHGHLALTYIALLRAHCAVKTERETGSIQLGREEYLRPLNYTGLDCANRRVVAPSGEWTWHVQTEAACYSSMMKCWLAMVNDKNSKKSSEKLHTKQRFNMILLFGTLQPVVGIKPDQA